MRIEQLARELGVTKGGFYWHFDDRGVLLDEMLDTWERVFVDEIIEKVEAKGGDGKTKLRHLFALGALDAELMQIDLAVRGWARRDRQVARRLRRVDNRRMSYMRSLFGDFCADEADTEVRCTLAFSLWLGHHLIASDNGTMSRAETLRLTLQRLLG